MIKKINSSTGNFEDQVTDTIVLDTVPTVNSFNTVTSDGVARAIAGASGGLPTSTSADEGKVLTVDANGDPEWDTASGGLPTSTSADEGKVLTVDSLGAPGWATPPKDAFLATYGTTAWADIAHAHNEGRPVFLYAPYSGSGVSGYLVPLYNVFVSNVVASENTYVQFITPLDRTERYNKHGYAIYTVDGRNIWTTAYGSASHVPDVTSSNANMFLKSFYSGVYSHGFYWSSIKEVPASTSSDEGKVLTVDSSGTAGWATPAVPAFTSADAGKVLQVQNDGTLAWVTLP